MCPISSQTPCIHDMSFRLWDSYYYFSLLFISVVKSNGNLLKNSLDLGLKNDYKVLLDSLWYDAGIQ